MKRFFQKSLVLGGILATLLQAQEPRQSAGRQLSFANSGPAAAQKSFQDGLAQLHNFEYETAAEDFRQAQSIDPSFCMAYWGEAMTYDHPVWYQQNLRAAQTVLKKLGPTEEARLTKCGTERERDYMRSVDIHYFSEGTKYERDFKYADAMAKLHDKYPDDVDAAALYALSILGTAHYGRDFAIYMKALAILEPLFYAHPDHPGVNHYLIHSVDDPIHAPLGLAAARNYSTIALDAAHAQHMTSHIFVAMGMWDDTVKANLEALKIENEQNAQHGRPPEYCGHYTSWLEYGYLEEGRLGDAGQVLKQCRVAALNGAARRQPQDMANINMYAHMFARYLLDSEDWNGEVAQWPALPRGKDDDADTTATLDFVDGFAAVRRNDMKVARSALADLATTDKTVNAKPLPPGVPPNPVMKRITLLDQELEAAIDAADGNRDKAIDLLQDVASQEMTIPFEYGPPFIDKPPEELLGEVLLSAGDAKEANMAFQGALSRTPERTQSLMGVWRTSKASGNTNGAAAAAAKLHAIWHNADQLPSELR